MGFKIKEIKAQKNIGLSYKDLPINPVIPIWKPGEVYRDRNGSRYPAAFIIEEKKTDQLQVMVHVTEGTPFKEEWELTASYKNSEEDLFQSTNLEWNSEERMATFDVSTIDFPAEFLWISGLLRWKLNWKKDTGDTVTIDLDETYLELFWIYDVDNTIFRKGVPIEILRQVAYAIRTLEGILISLGPPGSASINIKPAKESLIVAIVYGCFLKNPPVYDIYGHNSYFMIYTFFKDGITFQLDEYLKAVHDPMAVCNCYDQAAALQVYLKAVGINNVRFCYIGSSFYLKLTNLIGRGLCNNPYHIKKSAYDMGSPLVINETSDLRKPFRSHAFCCLPDVCFDPREGKEHPVEYIEHKHCTKKCNQCLILDSCIGPHSGSENIDTYIDNVADDIYPKETGETTNIGKITIFDGVTAVNWIQPPPKKGETDLPIAGAFKEMVDLPIEVPPTTSGDEYFVVCPWPDPRSCPVLGMEWDNFYHKTTPGIYDVIKTWRLRKKGEWIRIEIIVNSEPNVNDAFKEAVSRFYSLGSLTTLPGHPFKKGPSYLGEYAARCESEDFRMFLWATYNVTFSVVCRYEQFNIEALLVWLNELAFAHRVGSIKNYLPSVESINYKKQGDKVTISTGYTNLFIDFNFKEGNSLRLIEETDLSLIFQVTDESETKLEVVVVDKRTLLVNHKIVTINKKNNI